MWITSSSENNCLSILDFKVDEAMIKHTGKGTDLLQQEKQWPEFSKVYYLQSTDYLNLLTTISAK